MKKVLLIEDDLLYKELFEKNGITSGYQLSATTNLLDAKKFLLDNKFDVIFLDLNIEVDGDGKEFLTYIKEYNDNSEIKTPVIIITSSTEIEDVSHCISLRISDFWRKPFFSGKITHFFNNFDELTILD